MGTCRAVVRFSAMAFLPDGRICDPKGLILDASQAGRIRAIEARRAREAQNMVDRFFGLNGRVAAR
jgi:hypothetical protein